MKRLPTHDYSKQLRHIVNALIAMFATVCLDDPRQPLIPTDKTEFNPPGCLASCIDRKVFSMPPREMSCLPADNTLPESRMDIGSCSTYYVALQDGPRASVGRRFTFPTYGLRSSNHYTAALGLCPYAESSERGAIIPYRTSSAARAAPPQFITQQPFSFR